MREFFAKLLYKHCKREIEGLFLIEMYGMIPDDLSQPSIEFLINGKDKLEKFFSVQAYEMQRRSIMDSKTSQIYQGMLIHIKSILVLLRAGKPLPKSTMDIGIDKEDNPIDGVDDFIKMGKERNKKNGIV